MTAILYFCVHYEISEFKNKTIGYVHINKAIIVFTSILTL